MEFVTLDEWRVRVNFRPASKGDALSLATFLARIEPASADIVEIRIRKQEAMGQRVKLAVWYALKKSEEGEVSNEEYIRAHIEPQIENFWKSKRERLGIPERG